MSTRSSEPTAFGADAVTYSTLVDPKHSKGPVIFALPVDFIAVHLQIKRAKYVVLTPTIF